MNPDIASRRAFGEFLESKDDEERAYFLECAARGLKRQGKLKTLETILSCLEYLEEKLANLGIDACIADYDGLLDEELLLIQEALRLSAQAVERSPSQLYSQLYARLSWRKSDTVQSLLAREPRATWLRALNALVVRAGGAVRLHIRMDPESRTAITPDGRLAICASKEGAALAVRLWSLISGVLVGSSLLDQRGEFAIGEVVASQDGTSALVFINALDSAIMVVDFRRPEAPRLLDSERRIVEATSQDKTRKVEVFADGKIRIRNLQSRETEEVVSVSGAFGALRSSEALRAAVVVKSGGMVRLLDLGTGLLSPAVHDPGEKPLAHATTEDGEWVVVVVQDTVRVVNTKSGTVAARLTLPRTAASSTRRGSSRLLGLFICQEDGIRVRDGVSCSELRVIAVSRDHVRVWRIPTTATARTGSPERQTGALSAAGRVGRLLAPRRIGRTEQLDGIRPVHVVEMHELAVTSYALSPDGVQLIAGSRDGTIREWDLDRGSLRRTLRGHTQEVYAVAITPDGQVAISASKDGSLRAWSLLRGGGGITAHPVETSAPSPDLEDKASVLGEGMSRGSDKSRPSSYITALYPTPDGRKVLAAHRGHTVTVWNTQSHLLMASYTLDAGGYVFRVRPTKEFHAAVDLVDFFAPRVSVSEDGRRATIVTTAGLLAVVNVWSGLSGATEAKRISHAFYGIRDAIFSSDGRRLTYLSDDRSLTMIDLQTGETIRTVGDVELWVRPVTALFLLVKYGAVFLGPKGAFWALLFLWWHPEWHSLRYMAEYFHHPAFWAASAAAYALIGDDGILCRRFEDRLNVGIVMVGNDPPGAMLHEVAARLAVNFVSGRSVAGASRVSVLEQVGLVARILALPVVLPVLLQEHAINTFDPSKAPLFTGSLYDTTKSWKMRLGLGLVFPLRLVIAALMVFSWLMRDIIRLCRTKRRSAALMLFSGAIALVAVDAYLALGAGICVAVFCLVPDVMLAYFSHISLRSDGKVTMVSTHKGARMESVFFETETLKRLGFLDGNCCFLGSEGVLQLHKGKALLRDARDFRLKGSLDESIFYSETSKLVASDDGELVAIASKDALRVYDNQGNRRLVLDGRYRSPVFAAGGTLVCVGVDDNSLMVVDCEHAAVIAEFRADVELTACCVLEADGVCAVGDVNGGVWFFELRRELESS